MKIRVDRDVLAEALAWVARALPTRPVVPVLSGLRLDAGTSLTLSCFDYEVSATAQIEAEIGEPGTVIVPGRLLAEITRSLPALAVEIATDADTVNLTCGSAEFSLVALPADEYPELPPPPPLAGTMDGGVLGAAISQVVAAASRDDTLPMLTGVCLDVDGATLTLAATDRYRLAVRETPWEPVQPGLRAAALVPARTLADAARAMTAGVPVSVAFGPGAPAARPGDEPRPAEGMISFGIGGRRLHHAADRRRVHPVQVPVPGRVRLPGRRAGRAVHRGSAPGLPGRRPGQPGPAHVRPGPGPDRGADRGPGARGRDGARRLPR